MGTSNINTSSTWDKKIKEWQLHRRTGTGLQELAGQYNPVLRGWIGYYGRFNGSSLDSLFHHIDLRLSRKTGANELSAMGALNSGGPGGFPLDPPEPQIPAAKREQPVIHN